MKADAERNIGPWGVTLFYLALALGFYLFPNLRLALTPSGERMFLFAIPLLLGFALVGASAFTATYSRWWGARRGELTTSIMRNYLGIPLGCLGLVLAWLQPAPPSFVGGITANSVGWLLLLAGLVLFIWAHMVLGLPTGWPSVRDALMRRNLYACVRHPIYAGGLLMFVGGALLKPTITVLLACVLGFVWLIIQARLEEIDLVERIPEYREYMAEVPRFIPRLHARRPTVRSESRRAAD